MGVMGAFRSLLRTRAWLVRLKSIVLKVKEGIIKRNLQGRELEVVTEEKYEEDD